MSRDAYTNVQYFQVIHTIEDSTFAQKNKEWCHFKTLKFFIEAKGNFFRSMVYFTHGLIKFFWPILNNEIGQTRIDCIFFEKFEWKIGIQVCPLLYICTMFGWIHFQAWIDFITIYRVNIDRFGLWIALSTYDFYTILSIRNRSISQLFE